MTENVSRTDVSDLASVLIEVLGQRSFSRQPDSRAFGAHVEDAVVQAWPAVCAALGVRALPPPGRRSIYNVAWLGDDGIVGVDVRTKDLDTTRYSDGGICAVGNLLRWMTSEHGTLLIAEVGYVSDEAGAEIRYVATAPIHVLPSYAHRIENLGTGQVRLNAPIADLVSEADWSRTREEFFSLFSELCVDHYRRSLSRRTVEPLRLSRSSQMAIQRSVFDRQWVRRASPTPRLVPWAPL